MTGDVNVPAGKVAFSAAAAPMAEPWNADEAALVAYRQQLAAHSEDEDEAAPAGADGDGGGERDGLGACDGGGQPQKRVHPTLSYSHVAAGFTPESAAVLPCLLFWAVSASEYRLYLPLRSEVLYAVGSQDL